MYRDKKEVSMDCLVKDCKQQKESVYRINLEKHPFYPDGKGGQLGDRGKIGPANILLVGEDFILVEEALEENQMYPCTIDTARQVEIAEQHTAQHIFSALAYQMFGWNTVGFRMAEEYSTVDFDSQEISLEKIESLENKVNLIIKQALPVESFVISSEEAKKQEDLRKAIPEKIQDDIRMIEIPGVDLCACAGFHVNNTLEICLFKIIYQENVKGKFTRFHFLSGKRALHDYQKKHSITRFFSQEYSCKTEEILLMQQKSKEEKENFIKKYNQLIQNYALFLVEDLKKNAIPVDNHLLIFCEAETSLQNALGRYISLEKYSCIFTDGEKITLHSHHWNCKDIIQDLTSQFPNLKGGGSDKKGNIRGYLSQEDWIATLKK